MGKLYYYKEKNKQFSIVYYNFTFTICINLYKCSVIIIIMNELCAFTIMIQHYKNNTWAILYHNYIINSKLKEHI